jgi:hypothetical protein
VRRKTHKAAVNQVARSCVPRLRSRDKASGKSPLAVSIRRWDTGSLLVEAFEFIFLGQASCYFCFAVGVLCARNIWKRLSLESSINLRFTWHSPPEIQLHPSTSNGTAIAPCTFPPERSRTRTNNCKRLQDNGSTPIISTQKAGLRLQPDRLEDGCLHEH